MSKESCPTEQLMATFKLPSTHGWSGPTQGCDAGGTYTEWYADSDGGSGYGEAPYMQRWYGSDPPSTPDAHGWYTLVTEDGPDRTDPGYWQDNF